MATEGVERRLTTILSADVAGYSRLMGVDEEGTLQRLKDYREIIDGLISEHRGRVFSSAGDSVVAEFASPVEATRCALQFQRALGTRNASLVEDWRMDFRVGINLGDVMVEGENLFGDGVNVAARLEQLSEPGGICISRTARDQVRDKLEFTLEDLGEHEVKNIARPVRVFRVLIGEEAARARPPARTRPRFSPLTIISGVAVVILIVAAGLFVLWPQRPAPESAPPETAALSLPDKPSIAVLPFENMSGDPEQDYFADGITEDIITEFSKNKGLFVIARNSVFTYKGKAVKVRQVGRELGVRFILEGSVRRSGDRVRITAQLIDAGTGAHVWAERYDREIQDLFALQDEVTQRIVAAIATTQGTIFQVDKTRAARKRTESLSAYDHTLRGFDHFFRFTREDNARARQFAEWAIVADPGYARAHGLLAWAELMDVQFGWSSAPADSLRRGAEAARKSVDLDPSDHSGHWVLGAALKSLGQLKLAAASYDHALLLNPNDADLVAQWAELLTLLGRAEEAIEAVKRGMRLNPHYPGWYVWELGFAYYTARRYDDVVAVLTRHDETVPGFDVLLAVSYLRLGRMDEARAAMARFRSISPHSTVTQWAVAQPFKKRKDRAHFLDAMREAGLPD